MGKIIRRTVTITITETWTTVWLPDAEPQRQATTIVQDQPKTQEEPDEAHQTTVVAAEPGKPRPSDSTPPLTPAAATDPQPDGLSPRPAAGGKTCRTRRRRAAKA